MPIDDEIREQTPDRRYFTILPNLLDDMGLSPHAIRLYLRLKRRAGEDGICFENTENMAEGCNMSPATISRTKAELEIAGLITIKKRKSPHGHFPGHVITIIDIWKSNIEFYDNKSPVSVGNRTYSPGSTRPVSVVTYKKNPIKKNPREKE